MTDLKIEVDDQLVKDASELFEGMGLDLPTAIRLFLEKSIEDENFPFDYTYNAETEQAFKDVEEGNLTSYDNFDEFWAAINKDDK
ncbi:MAG: type II toxin-antitoxin system RelB/DinJ family antitoxin [Aerococcus urinaeequi]